MTCKCAPTLLLLRGEVDQRWPGRDKTSDGCCGDQAHAGRRSDHNADASGYAHAIDIDENILPNMGDKPLLFLVAILLADPRAKYVIYERRIYYRACNVHGDRCFQAGGHAYTGPNAHDKHLHLSIRAGTEHDTRRWLALAEEDDLTDAERKTLNEINRKLDAVRAGIIGGEGFTDLKWLDDRLKKTAADIIAALKK